MSKILERIKQLQDQQSKIEFLESYAKALYEVSLPEQYKEVHARMLALISNQIQADIHAIERQADISTETTKDLPPVKPAPLDNAFDKKWGHLKDQMVLAKTQQGGTVRGKVIGFQFPKVKVSFDKIGIFLIEPESLTLEGDTKNG